MNSTTVINADSRVYFNNSVDHCVGTGRLGLALTEEYQKQLAMVQKEIGFTAIRGHGLFSDDVSIYHEYEENGETRVEYNYTYVDRIFDSYQKLGIRPFLELGFMPGELASGEQTIFYWKGNTTPPKDYSKWNDMVVSLLRHLRGRYGDTVLDWEIEVWNEPNLPGFWKDADMDEYFRLFRETFTAIKAYDSRFRVGGPAICGVFDEKWMRAFLDFCRENALAPDFITRHHYTVEFPEECGHSEYSKLEDPDMRIATLQNTRDIVDSYEEFRGLPIHITEFSTSYTPHGVIHDTNLNAAYIAQQLSRLGDMNASYSYWTFGDVFEEKGVPFSPFHGGFGLVANGCIPKPTFWTFSFYKQLKNKGGDCVMKDSTAVVTKNGDSYAGMIWNISEETLSRTFEIPVCGGEYTLITKTVDEECCNPLRLWHDMGEPQYPTEAENELLRSAAHPAVHSDILTASEGKLTAKLDVKKSGVLYFEISPRTFTPVRGYDYNRTVTFR